MTHPFETLALPGPDDRLKGVKGDVTFLLGPVDLGDSINFCNPQWYARGLNDNDNTGSGCASRGLQPFCLAI